MAKLQRPLIVGLTINPEMLAQIRRTRQRMLGLEQGDQRAVSAATMPMSIGSAASWCWRAGCSPGNKWPEIDVTKRSVEETAAAIYQMIQVRQQPELKALAAVLPNPGWTGDGP